MTLAVYCVAVLHRLPAPDFRQLVDSTEEESRTSEEPCEPHYRAFDNPESEHCGLEIRRARRSVTALARSKHRGETALVDVYGYEEQFPDCFSHGSHVTEMYGQNQGRHVHFASRQSIQSREMQHADYPQAESNRHITLRRGAHYPLCYAGNMNSRFRTASL